MATIHILILNVPISFLNVLISSEKYSLPVLLSVTTHSNATLSPWSGESLLRGEGRRRRVRTLSTLQIEKGAVC